MARKRLFERLKAGLEEGIAHQKGELELNVVEVNIPDPPRVYGSAEIKSLRRSFRMSQASFSKLLAVSKKTVEGWEQGVRVPTGSAARLLQFIEDPKLLQISYRRQSESVDDKSSTSSSGKVQKSRGNSAEATS